ncbi:MAG: xanthine dehydrogenase family protein molybdopterin-binding subunit [Pseudomonadota bacterium]
MSAVLTRRHFLIAGAAATGGLLVGCGAPTASERLGHAGDLPVEGGQVSLNGWVKIAPDGQVTVAVPRAEMGQGVLTALPMLLIEELEARWEDVHVEHAPVAQIYANQALLLNVLPFGADDDGLLARMARASIQRVGYALHLQVTGGSSSVRDAWHPLRLAGATARAMLVQAAAQRWKVEASACRVEAGQVLHPTTGARLGFGELVHEAAKLTPPEHVPLKDPATYTLIGKPIARKDIPAKLNGSAVFGVDVRVPDMLYAAILQPPVFGASVVSVDAVAASQMRGVHKVLQIPAGVVVVVANSWWRAQQALASVKVQFSATPNDNVTSADIARQFRQALDQESGFAFINKGDAAEALKAPAKVVEAVYWAPYLAHAAMEPINCTAQVQQGRVEVWVSTQSPSLAKWRAAQIAGVDTDQVTLHLPLLGGGFGRRLEIDMVEQAVAIAMQLEGRPVKLLWSREEDTQHDMYRPAALSAFRAALDDKGRVTAWHNRVAAQSVGYDALKRLLPWAAADTPDKNQIEGAFDIPYAFDNIEVRQVRTKGHVPVGSWRSVGHSYNAFFTESFVDELAHACGQDPYAYRRSLLTAHPRHRAVLELAATKAGWGQALPAGRARGIALHESFGSICAQVAEVSVVNQTVKVHRVVCAIDCGVVVNPDTVVAQMQGSIVFGLSSALFGEITVAAGRVEQSSFPNYDMVRLEHMPVIETHIVQNAHPPGGVGEPGTPPIAPAVTNALYALTKQRIRSLPIKIGHAQQ